MGADARLAAHAVAGRAIAADQARARRTATTRSGFSHASAAIAETGTLVLASGTDNPTTINFLPEHHIVVVDAADIAGDLETVLGQDARRASARATCRAPST